MTVDWAKEAARLQPSAFLRYLRTRGWQEEEARNHKLMRFTRAVDQGTVEVEIPTRSTFADYARRVREAVEIVALVEGLPISEVCANLAMPSFDVVSFRFTGEASAGGMISLDDSYRIRKARKQLLLAMAHSVVEPLPHFSRLSRTEPVEFLASCREAPPRAGSYESPILVPVSPAVGQLELAAPFARLVTTLLGGALVLARNALERGDDDALLKNARAGLSSNFLGALAELAPPGGRGTLDIDFTWSYARPVPAEPPGSVSFGETLFAPLAEAARVLRETTEIPGIEVEGYIVRLEREADAEPGMVVLATTLEDRPGTSKVQVELGPREYQAAAKAHVNGSRVRLTGSLVRTGRKLALQNPGGMVVLPEGD
jgi:hypothetical protein